MKSAVNKLDDEALFRQFIASEEGFLRTTTETPSEAFTTTLDSPTLVSRDSAITESSSAPRPTADMFKTLDSMTSAHSRMTTPSVVTPPSAYNAPTPSYGEFPGSSGTTTCSDHRDKMLDVYCNTCAVPICTQCALFGKHQGHRCSPIDQAFKSCSSELKTHLSRLEQNNSTMKAFLAELMTMRSQIGSSADACAEQIRNNINYLKAALDQKLTALLKEVDEAKEARTNQLEEQVIKVHQDIESYDKLVQLGRSLLNNPSPAQYLKRHRELSQQISEAGNEFQPLKACVDADLAIKLSIAGATQSVSDLSISGSTVATQAATASSDTFVHDLDKNGIMHYLGTTALGVDRFVSPVASGLVEVSSSEWGYDDHVERVCWEENPSSVFTAGKISSWIAFTLNDGYRVRPTRYRIQHAGDCGTHVLRNWVLEGSADGQLFDILCIHNNDTSLDEVEGAHHSWEIAPTSVKHPYSVFRITVTSHNSSGGYHLMLGSLELWGHIAKY